MSKLDHAASLISSDAAAKQKATLQQRTTNRKSINTGYNVLFLRRKVARERSNPPRDRLPCGPCSGSLPSGHARTGGNTMSACVITAEIFDAFLKCESKAYFKSLGQIGEPDELVDWQREVKQDFRGVS